MKKTSIYDIADNIAQRNGKSMWDELPEKECIRIILEGIASIIDNS